MLKVCSSATARPKYSLSCSRSKLRSNGSAVLVNTTITLPTTFLGRMAVISLLLLFLALQHYRIVVSKVNDIIVMNNAEGQPHAK